MGNSILNNSNSGNLMQTNNTALLNQIKQFRKTFGNGDPKQAVMNMVSQGTRTNEQLQQAMQMAQQLMGSFK